MKQKLLKDIRTWSGVFKDQLPHSADYYFDLFILGFNKLTERIPKDNISLRDQKALLLHNFDNDFEEFIKALVEIQAKDGKKSSGISLSCPIESLEQGTYDWG